MSDRTECELRYLLWEMEWRIKNNEIEKALESLKNANIVANRLFKKGVETLEGKINSDGALCIKRAGVLKKQACPFKDDVDCGDKCPLLQEPRWISKSSCSLNICKTAFHFDVFHDQRRVAE